MFSCGFYKILQNSLRLQTTTASFSRTGCSQFRSRFPTRKIIAVLIKELIYGVPYKLHFKSIVKPNLLNYECEECEITIHADDTTPYSWIAPNVITELQPLTMKNFMCSENNHMKASPINVRYFQLVASPTTWDFFFFYWNFPSLQRKQSSNSSQNVLRLFFLLI